MVYKHNSHRYNPDVKEAVSTVLLYITEYIISLLSGSL